MGLYFRARVGPIVYMERLDDDGRQPTPPDTHGRPSLVAALWAFAAIAVFVVVPCLVAAVIALH